MQLFLSNLLDLALGTESPNCNNFSALHTVLHVVLKKLNLADTLIELTEETAKDVESLVKNMPTEPAICFKEYHLKPDGCKIRKKKYHVAPKKSLTLISKRWPKCSPENPKPELNELMVRIQSLAKAMNCRIANIEEELDEIAGEINNANSKNVPTHVKSKVSFCGDDDATENVIIEQVSWLNEKILELSNSLTLHSNCLKKVKCEMIPKIRAHQVELTDTICRKINELEKKIDSDVSQSSTVNIEERSDLVAHIDCLSEEIHKLEKDFGDYKNEMSSELRALNLTLVSKTCENMYINTNSDMSRIVKSQNLQECEGQESSEFDCCKPLKILESALAIDSDAVTTSKKSQTASIERFGEASIFKLKEQLSSHNICMNQLIRDLAQKVDRKEFECFRREFCDVCDEFLQLKKDMNTTPMAAACTVPLMTNMNCLSCQTTANMTISSTGANLPSLNFGHQRISTECLPDNSQRMQDCKDFKRLSRRAGGSATKISRRSVVSRMKYKKLSAPYRCATPLIIYKNRYRKLPFNAF